MPAYIGVNGKAKSISKVYVGNSNGKAELIWGPKGPNRYSKDVDGLSIPRYSLSGSEVGDYALFAGGLTEASSTNSEVASDVVDAYDKTLTRTTATKLSVGRYGIATAKTNNYAIFAGGEGYSNIVDAYNSSLTRKTPSKLSVGRKSSAACGAGYYIAVAGGNTSSGYSKVVDGYDYNLTRTSPTALSEEKSSLVGVATGTSSYTYVLFAGGYSGSKHVSTVEVYSYDLTKYNNAAPLSVEKSGCVSATFEIYGIIAGGSNLSHSNTVDVYNNSLSKITAASLTSASTDMVSTVLLNEYVLFCGYADSKYSIDAYDPNLTKVLVKFGVTRTSIAAANVGDYALFAGGRFNSVSKSTVDAFHIFE